MTQLAYNLLDLLEAARVEGPGSSTGSRRTGSTQQLGTASFDEAVQLIRRGWPEGAQRMHALLGPAQDAWGRLAQELQRRDTVFDVTGEVLYPDRFAAGDPACFERTITMDPEGLPDFVTLVSDLSEAHACSDADLVLHAASLVGTCDLLVLLGRGAYLRCGGGLVHVPPHGDDRLEIELLLHQAGQIPDRHAIVTCVAQRSVMQRLVASVAEQHGFHAQNSRPSPLPPGPDPVPYGFVRHVTRPVPRGTAPTPRDLILQVVDTCRRLGMVIDDAVVRRVL